MSSEPTAVKEWLSTPLGRRCLANEQRLMRRALERVFGEQMLQIGAWGARNSFLRYARTQRRALVDWRPGVAADLVCDPEQLAVASDSVDAVLLPHTLERTPSPHAVLREVDRVLRADGHLIVLSFAPGGFWGLRHLLSSGGYPQGRDHADARRPVARLARAPRSTCRPRRATATRCRSSDSSSCEILPREEWAQRWLPVFSGGYMLHAQKRVQPLTPVVSGGGSRGCASSAGSSSRRRARRCARFRIPAAERPPRS